MVGWIFSDVMTKDSLMSREIGAYINLIMIDDFGFEKGQAFFGI